VPTLAANSKGRPFVLLNNHAAFLVNNHAGRSGPDAALGRGILLGTPAAGAGCLGGGG